MAGASELAWPEHLAPVALAGLAGALVRTLHAREAFGEAMRTAVTGTLTAAFTWPLARPFLETHVAAPLAMSPIEHQLFGGFAIGAGGALMLGFGADLFRFKQGGPR